MLKSFIILLSIYSEICSCFESYVNFDVSRKNNIKRFPWMVIISGEDKTKMHAYGTLIHERAVLTLTNMDFDEPHNIKFKVFARCYSNTESTINYHCSKVRDIIEYNILEGIQLDYEDNLAILILSKPFILSETINVIHFAKNDKDYHHHCAIMSLRYQINSRNHTQTATLVTSTEVEITSRYDIIYHDFYHLSINASNGFKLIDDRGQVEEFIGDDLRGQTLDYSGSPIVCKSKQNKDRWLLVGVADFKIIFGTNELLYDSNGFKVDINDIQAVFNEIIEESDFPGKEHHGSQLNFE